MHRRRWQYTPIADRVTEASAYLTFALMTALFALAAIAARAGR
jgi:hypothetical protein